MAKGDVINKILINNALIAKKALEQIKQRAADLQKKQASEAAKKNEKYRPPIIRHQSTWLKNWLHTGPHRGPFL